MSNNTPDKVHAELGASAAHRWIPCPGSVQLSRGRPTFDNEHSIRGTVAHHIIERCLKEGIKPKVFLDTTIDGVEVDEDLVEGVQVFLDVVSTTLKIPGARWWPERKFSLAKLNPPGPMFGTCDLPVHLPSMRKLFIYDYKNGYVIVEARNNPQLKYYALGAVLDLEDELGPLEIDEVILTIVQPNAFHPAGVVRHETISYVDLLEFAGELLDAAKRTLEPDAPLVAGPHCKYCPASAICPAQRDYTQETAQLVFAEENSAPPAPETLTPDALAFIMSRLPQLEQWAADVRQHAQTMLERGEIAPEALGQKLVEKRPTRRWVSETQVEKWLRDSKGYADEEIFTQKIKSPAQVEKLMGKDKKSIPTDFIIKESSGVTMVPLSDKREAVTLAAPDVFQALPPGDE